ncbi:alpha/beta hydrolase [Rhodococcus sp. IEGM 1408]|uniref:alpha/beta fold hydrolase n=1 Tax=Rhodococcus sp. IEGM 1408 TaxID=3082220 RepID=UPI002955210D|nr:alpha/beta hydrolase [Rhodococcus sp. IEGM 1408]MDV8002265.1 alpha/beta hydrolase [Rhodococcus sp. IEGM 1408]
MDSGLVDTRLGRLHVEVVGEGPPLVLWHSMFVDSGSWNRVVPGLAGAHRLFLIDAPSCGRSDPLRAAADISACAEAAIEVLERVRASTGQGGVDWLGNAWGGHVGIEVAARRPDLIGSLVAVSAPTHPIDPALRRRIRMLVPLYRLIGPHGPVRSAIEETIFTDRTRAHDPEAVRVLRGALERAGRTATIRAIETAILHRADLRAAALGVTCPVLFVTTDDRGEWTPEQARAVAAEMVDAREATVRGARVIPALEQPEALLRTLDEFWKGPARH